jgi:predicted nucleic acid-binding protein
MEAPVLIDSNVFIGHLKAMRDPILEISRQVDLENVVCCGLVKAEVLRGIKTIKVRDRLKDFFGLTKMVGTNASLWDEAWTLAWKLDRQGKVLPLQDIVIACCAMRAGALVMTHDVHFSEIPGLKVIRPAS